MYICLCNAVTQRQVEDSAREGVRSVDELATRLGVGTGCGRCRECAAELLRETCTALCRRPAVDFAG